MKRYLILRVYDNDVIIFEKARIAPNEILAALQLFDRDTLRIDVSVYVDNDSHPIKN